MRKLPLLLLASLISFIASSQDIEKIRQQVEKDAMDTVNFPYGNQPKNGSFYTIRGMKMYVEVYGEGEPLLFIHGNGGSINNFLYQIPYFSKKYKVIVADSRSQGRSEDRKDSLTYEMMADDYAALLEAMKIQITELLQVISERAAPAVTQEPEAKPAAAKTTTKTAKKS